MTIEELKAALARIAKEGEDTERDHYEADQLLLAFINDKEVTDLFESIERWYA